MGKSGYNGGTRGELRRFLLDKKVQDYLKKQIGNCGQYGPSTFCCNCTYTDCMYYIDMYAEVEENKEE